MCVSAQQYIVNVWVVRIVPCVFNTHICALCYCVIFVCFVQWLRMINMTVCVCLGNCSRFRRAGKDIGRAKMLSALNQSIKKPIWSAATGLRPNTFVDGDLYYRVFNNYFHIIILLLYASSCLTKIT